jgi:hypothetical protein
VLESCRNGIQVRYSKLKYDWNTVILRVLTLGSLSRSGCMPVMRWSRIIIVLIVVIMESRQHMDVYATCNGPSQEWIILQTPNGINYQRLAQTELTHHHHNHRHRAISPPPPILTRSFKYGHVLSSYQQTSPSLSQQSSRRKLTTKRPPLLPKRLRLTLLQLGQPCLLSSLLLEPPDVVARLADRVFGYK